MIIDPKEISTAKLHAYMLSSIAPRPIAFASTIDKNGVANLSPFSFFNAFGSNPPTLIFSPARRVRDKSIKHTLENIYETGEVVINTVNYNMVQQMSLTSVEFPKGVDEFVKAGFTKLESQIVKPFRVKESPVQMECKVIDVKEMGQEGGAANLIICELLMMHINDEVLDADGHIDQHKIDLVARLGGNWYSRNSGNALFEVTKPNLKPAIGFDLLPDEIRNSTVLSGNDLGKLANAEHLPTEEELSTVDVGNLIEELKTRFAVDDESLIYHKHLTAKDFLDNHELMKAWKVLLR